jgi:hypothetical protein
MTNPLFSRVANALVESAESKTGSTEKGLAGESPKLSKSLSAFEQHSPGLWVGGRLAISDTDVNFTPNALNRATYAAMGGEVGTITVPFASIRSVEVQRGLVTNIIRIHTASFVVNARCFGARSVAARIQPNAELG